LPDGNLADLRRAGQHPEASKNKGAFREAMKDKRVWALFFLYAACFGIELTINNIAAIYFTDYFGLGLKTAGLVAGLFGLMNIFARTAGGFVSDKFVERYGLKGRVRWLWMTVFLEGVALIAFSQSGLLVIAIPAMIVFSLFVQMSEGATYSVVPFINKRALGAVSGIVGAGGNFGAVTAGFLFRTEQLTYPQALLILGLIVTGLSFFAMVVHFSPAAEREAESELQKALALRRKTAPVRSPKKAATPVFARLRPMDALRVYLGIALVVKGVYFILNMADLEARLGGQLGEVQNLIAWGVVFAHVVGGASLAMGFVTRLSAGVNAVIVMGAMLLSLLKATGAGLLIADVDFQFTSFVFFCLALLTWQGPGPLSLDRLYQSEDQTSPVTT
ncbi:MAG: MFS transporter, partial [Pirellulaceae bacterium]